ncbi:MAG: multicopper oxidase domain-containing protein [Actinomycetota bacterium]
MRRKLSRRDVLRAGGISAASVAVGGVLGRNVLAQNDHSHGSEHSGEHSTGVHGGLAGMVGRVDHKRNGFDPSEILYDFDTGDVSKSGDQSVRTYEVFAQDKEVEIAPGLFFPAWTYNGRIPGPTLRATEGDRLRIRFTNGGSHPHTIHFHGLHPARMDGVPGVGRGDVMPGETFTYEFDAFPFGCHLYHCHSNPLRRHIHKGLYGAFIIDPDPKRHPDQADAAAKRSFARAKDEGINEMVMVMNSFDTDFDGGNEVYAVNTVGFAYANEPIPVSRDETVRVYLVNITEFDPINSFHLHGNFFNYYDTGTSLEPTVFTDTIMQCQAQRGILEFNFKGYEPGMHMFHAHQTEFVELGWMGMFDVR